MNGRATSHTHNPPNLRAQLQAALARSDAIGHLQILCLEALGDGREMDLPGIIEFLRQESERSRDEIHGLVSRMVS